MNQLDVSLQHTIATLAAQEWSARKIARELGHGLQYMVAHSEPAS